MKKKKKKYFFKKNEVNAGCHMAWSDRVELDEHSHTKPSKKSTGGARGWSVTVLVVGKTLTIPSKRFRVIVGCLW